MTPEQIEARATENGTRDHVTARNNIRRDLLRLLMHDETGVETTN